MRRASAATALACTLRWLQACALAGLLGCAARLPEPAAWEETRSVLGVEVRVIVRHPEEPPARTAIDEAFGAAEATGRLLLAEHAGSEIDLLMRVPSHLWVEISPATHAALTRGARIASETDGAYDYTWPVLLRTWGLRAGGTPRVPRDFEIDMALRRVDWEDVELRDDEGLQARRLHRRTEIDLGGLARGAMLDAAVARLVDLGIAAARASTAAEHAFFGGSDPHPWRIALPAGALALADGAVAVARTREPVETASGVSIQPVFDPRSGRPVPDSGWVAASARTAADSAGYAAALLCLGDDARAFVETHEMLEAVVVRGDEAPWASAGLARAHTH